MQEFFKALNNFKPKERQKPKVTIQGQVFEVDMELFKQVMSNGEDQYEIKKGKITSKPRPKNTEKSYEILVKAEKGHVFVNGDIYWPADIKEGGFKWQSE